MTTKSTPKKVDAARLARLAKQKRERRKQQLETENESISTRIDEITQQMIALQDELTDLHSKKLDNAVDRLLCDE
jgi:hypothetical protein